jgi:hypothetical protein
MRQSTTSEQREGYNNVLDRAFRHGNYDGELFVKQLTQLMDQGEVDLTTDEIAEAGRGQQYQPLTIFHTIQLVRRSKPFLGRH